MKEEKEEEEGEARERGRMRSWMLGKNHVLWLKDTTR